MIRPLTVATLGLLCAAAFSVTARAQAPFENSSTAKAIPGQIVVDEATGVIDRVKQNARMAALIDQAKAVLVVPHYGETLSAALGRAERASPAYNAPTAIALTKNGNPGVFLLHSAVSWSSPAFFSVAGNDTSPSYASDGIPVVVVFMTNKAFSAFMSTRAAHQIATNGTFSLSGLNVASYSTPQRSLTDADVIVWTPSGRRFTSDEFYFDAVASDAYYRNDASLEQILTDFVGTQRSAGLQSSLSIRVASVQ